MRDDDLCLFYALSILLQVVGNTTSGCYGWQVGSSIAMAYLPLNLVNNGQTVQVQLLNGVFDATVNKAPWVKHETRR